MKKGFTLVELMIIISIIAMLAAIAIPSFIKSREETRRKRQAYIEMESKIANEINSRVDLEKTDKTTEQITKENNERAEKIRLINETLKLANERAAYIPERLFEIDGVIVYRANDHQHGLFYFTVPKGIIMKKGFTIIELMIVIAIVSLGCVIVFMPQNKCAKQKESEFETQEKQPVLTLKRTKGGYT